MRRLILGYFFFIGFFFSVLLPFMAHAETTTTPNMSLLAPVPGQDPGPQWAYDLNTSLYTIDQHNHSAGSGVQITPSGINLNSDLPYANNNATGLRSARFQVQGSPLSKGSDLACASAIGTAGDLYWNDANGNQIRLTQSGAIAGSPGSISGLVSPASATYNPATSTFIWQSAVSTAANMDAGSIILRDITSGSKGVTVNPPAALAADYALTFPATLPASQKFMTLDASGNIAAPWTVDNSTIEISTNALRVKPTGAVTVGSLSCTGNGTIGGTATVSSLTLGNVQSSASGVLSSTNVFTSSFCTAFGSNCSSTPCTTGSNYGGGIASITRGTTGAYGVNFTSSFWSAAPACTVSAVNGNTVCAINQGAPSTVSYGVACAQSFSGANTDSTFCVTCVGPRN